MVDCQGGDSTSAMYRLDAPRRRRYVESVQQTQTVESSQTGQWRLQGELFRLEMLVAALRQVEEWRVLPGEKAQLRRREEEKKMIVLKSD